MRYACVGSVGPAALRPYLPDLARPTWRTCHNKDRMVSRTLINLIKQREERVAQCCSAEGLICSRQLREGGGVVVVNFASWPPPVSSIYCPAAAPPAPPRPAAGAARRDQRPLYCPLRPPRTKPKRATRERSDEEEEESNWLRCCGEDES